MNSKRVQLDSSVKKTTKMPKSNQVVPFTPVSPTHAGSIDALGHDQYDVQRGTGTVVENGGIDFNNFQSSTASDWGDMSPHKKIPRASFTKMKTQVKSRARLEQITKDGHLLKWFRTGPATIGKYSQSLGLELYFRFVRNGCRLWCLYSLLALPLLIACALPSESDGQNGVSALGMFTLASFGEVTKTGAASTATSAAATAASATTAATSSSLLRVLVGENEQRYRSQLKTGTIEATRALVSLTVKRDHIITYPIKDWFSWLDPNAVDISMKVEELTPYLALFMGCGSIVFLFYVLWFRHRTIGVAAEKLDAASITPSDFTVMIDKLPRLLYLTKHGSADDFARQRNYKELLKQHIEKVLNDERERKRNLKKCCGLIKAPEAVPRGRAVVEDISLVHDFDGRLKHHMDDMKLRAELISAKKWKDEKRANKLEKKIARIVAKRERQNRKRRLTYGGKVQDDLEKEDRRVLRAYVTVGQAFDVASLLHMYKFADYGCLRLCQSRKKRFFKNRIRIRTAPEPTNILWENQDISLSDWSRRRVVTSFVTLIIIAVSITMIMLSKTYGDAETERLRESTAKCPAGAPTIARVGDGETMVKLTAETAKAWIADQAKNTKDFAVKNSLSHCQCSGISQTTLGTDTELRSACWDYLVAQAFLLGMTMGAAFIVIFINVVLKGALTKLSKWERPLTISALECSIVSKIFIAQFLNTGIIILILNSKRLFGAIFGGNYEDFNQRWYATVGGAIAMTMAINVLSPHMIAVVAAKVKKCKVACCAACCVNTINGLRNVYDPPPYELAARAGALLNTMFCTLTYSPGCPILIPFAFLNFLLVYNCDKFVLLKVSKRPPAWDALVIETMCNILRSALVLNALFGIWMMGNEKTFPSVDFYGMNNVYETYVKEYIDAAHAAMGDGSDNAAEQWNLAQVQYIMATFVKRAISGAGMPYFALFLLIIVYFLLRFITFLFTSTIGTVLDVLYQTCCKKQRMKMDHAEDHVSWKDARAQMEEAKIVTSYMVEKHPQYSRMFEDVDFSASDSQALEEVKVEKGAAGYHVDRRSAGPNIGSPAKRGSPKRMEEESEEEESEEETSEEESSEEESEGYD